MNYTYFNTDIATQSWPELSLPLTEEELEALRNYCVLELGHLPDIPVRAIFSGP